MHNFMTVIFLFITLGFSLQSCTISDSAQRKYREMQTRATDEAINRSAALQELNRVCTGIDLPADFVFVWKGGIDDQKVSLAYHYTSKISFEDARSGFRGYFLPKGWSETDLSDRYPQEIDFSDGKYRIAISQTRQQDDLRSYAVYCEKLKN